MARVIRFAALTLLEPREGNLAVSGKLGRFAFLLVILFYGAPRIQANCTAYQYNTSAGAMQQVTNTGNAYYIDPVGGNDSNNGTSSSTPWKHHPFETGSPFAGQSYTHAAGDCFYFKGGTSVTNANLGIIINLGGSAGAGSDYYGPDPNHIWFAGASWVRPILNGGGASIVAGGSNAIVEVAAAFVTVDYFDIKGQWENDAIAASTGSYAFHLNQTGHVTMSRNYIHGWQYPAGSTRDQFIAAYGDSKPGTYYVYNIIDGTDSPSPHQAYQGPFICCSITNYNIIHDAGNGFNTQCCDVKQDVGYNLFYNLNNSFDSINHTALVEPATAAFVHDNVAHDIATAVVYDLATDGADAKLYFYNNIGWNSTSGNPWLIASAYGPFSCGGPCGTAYLINNTFDGGGNNIFRYGIPVSSQIIAFNNHLINCGGSSQKLTDCELFTGNPPVSSATNLIQTLAQATSAGYNSAQVFAYSPTAQSSPTVGAGTNETSLCSASVYLCVDSTYGVTQSGSTPGTAIPVLARSRRNRPPTGAWDIGAYLFNSVSSGQPNAPTGLSAAVN